MYLVARVVALQLEPHGVNPKTVKLVFSASSLSILFKSKDWLYLQFMRGHKEPSPKMLNFYFKFHFDKVALKNSFLEGTSHVCYVLTVSEI